MPFATFEGMEMVFDQIDTSKITGFYSYGEIAPLNESLCELHHQTMTITTLSEC